MKLSPNLSVVLGATAASVGVAGAVAAFSAEQRAPQHSSGLAAAGIASFLAGVVGGVLLLIPVAESSAPPAAKNVLLAASILGATVLGAGAVHGSTPYGHSHE